MLEYASQFLNTFTFMTLPMDTKWAIALIVLLISGSLASACCCQNSTAVRQVSVEELRLMFTEGNLTEYNILLVSKDVRSQGDIGSLLSTGTKQCCYWYCTDEDGYTDSNHICGSTCPTSGSCSGTGVTKTCSGCCRC